MKQTLINTLTKINVVLNSLDDQYYSDKSVAPFYSSVGGHVRHILDFYDAIIDGNSTGKINLVNRKRDQMVENFTNIATQNVNRVLNGLKELPENYDRVLVVIDNLGDGDIQVPYTLGGVLSHANSHAIHHYAIISYILDQLNIVVEDATFGYNPSTPKAIPSQN